MGPRFIDRGNAAAFAKAVPEVPLQWGRGSLTAEMKNRRIQPPDTHSFNGAAVH